MGYGTTVPTNPGIYNSSEGYVNYADDGGFRFENATIPSYFVLNGNILLDIKPLRGVRFGFQIRNILNKKFYPGPAQASATIGMIDQPDGMIIIPITQLPVRINTFYMSLKCFRTITKLIVYFLI